MKMKRIFRSTYFSHHVTMSGYFPSCSPHLVHSCWIRLLVVASSKTFVLIFYTPLPPCSRKASSLIRMHTARCSVNAEITLSTHISDHWVLYVLYSIKACRSMTSLTYIYDSGRDYFAHIDKTEAGDLFFSFLKFIFPVQLVFVRTQLNFPLWSLLESTK